MHFKLLILSLVILLMGCWETHERDNPLDQEGKYWDDQFEPQPSTVLLSLGSADTILYDCSVPNDGNIVRYYVEYEYQNKKVMDTSDNGKFPIYVGEDDLFPECIVEDASGAKLRSRFRGAIHRNQAPQVDSTPHFQNWTELEWETGKGKGMLSFFVRDEDGDGHFDVRIDLDGQKGKWNAIMGVDSSSGYTMEILASFDYKSTPHYRLVVRDSSEDSAVVEGVLQLDTIAPCKYLGAPYFTDIRDGRKYSCAWIGGRSWMTENVDFGVLTPAKNAQGDNSRTERYCPGDSIPGCKTSGAYYQWAEAVGEDYDCNKYGTCAMDVHSPRGVCPLAWHVPSKDEWQTLLKADELYPEHPFFENMLHGYVALDGDIQDSREKAYFWTTTTDAGTSALDHSLSIRFSGADTAIQSLGFRMEERRRGLSVRCVMD